MKRVAIVTRNFSNQGGLEHYTHKLVEGILAEGYEVTVICDENHSTLQAPHLYVVKFSKPPKNLSKHEKLDWYFNEAARVVRKSGPFSVIHSQHFAIDNPDVVTFHNHTVARLSKCGKRWENFINLLKSKFRASYKYRDKSDRLLATKARVLIFPSANMQSDFEEHFCLKKVGADTLRMVAYPGTDDFPSNPCKSLSDHTPFTFVFVGRGYRKKGLDVLLAACSKLVSRGHDFRLVIAGLEEKFIDKLRLMILSLSKQVSYLGFVNSMSEVYNNAQAIILPSRIEPFGMAPLEAMSYAVVPIVSKVSGVSEILTDKVDALILQNHLDSEELANLMASLINNQTLTQSLARQTQITASKFTWQQTIDVTVSAYEKVIASKRTERLNEVGEGIK